MAKKAKCDRPGCRRKGTVRMSNNGQTLVVCQVDVNWAHGQLFGGRSPLEKGVPGGRKRTRGLDNAEDEERTTKETA